MASSEIAADARQGYLAVVLAALGYLALGALGLSFAIAPGYASSIFPAAGFAVAILLWSEKCAWPGILAGSILLNLGVAWLHDDLNWRGAWVAAGIACGSTLQALAAWSLPTVSACRAGRPCQT